MVSAKWGVTENVDMVGRHADNFRQAIARALVARVGRHM
jgi:hypothetical protein